MPIWIKKKKIIYKIKKKKKKEKKKLKIKITNFKKIENNYIND
jgi:hypothetical protein